LDNAKRLTDPLGGDAQETPDPSGDDSSENPDEEGGERKNKTGGAKQKNKCREEDVEERDDERRKRHEKLYGISTNVFGKNINSSNAAGYIGHKNYSISQNMRIKSCDQVLQIKGQYLKDMEDFSIKGTAFFTMSMYLINMFDERNPAKLVESINLRHITKVPDKIRGAKGCLDFVDGKDKKEIAMCLESLELQIEVKEAFQQFMRCRMGDNLNEIPVTTIRKIFQGECLGKNVKLTSKFGPNLKNFLKNASIRDKLKARLQKHIFLNKAHNNADNKWDSKYMTPVPGSKY